MNEDELAVVERAEVSDSDDDFEYRGVEEDKIPPSDDEEEADLAAAFADAGLGLEGGGSVQVVTQLRPSVADDFIRNFLIKAGLSRTLDVFNTEWFESQSKGRLGEEHTSYVPDIYLRNDELTDQVDSLRQQVVRMQEVTERAQGTWDKFRKERDFHRLHHKRVVQEKARLSQDLKRLKKHYKAYEPTLQELQRKYQAAMKEKMLIKLERDRIKAKLETVEAQLVALETNTKKSGTAGTDPPYGSSNARSVQNSASRENMAPVNSVSNSMSHRTGTSSATQQPTLGGKKKKDSVLAPDDPMANPFAAMDFPAAEVEHFSLKRSFKGHLNALAAMAFHPRRNIIATVSDDETWKIWSLPNCDLIMSGEGHRNWVAGVCFHPQGSCLATASGDSTVKLWDFKQAACSATFSDHTQAVWDVAFHHLGDFLASCSMDHTVRLWDAHSLRCRQTFRGHVDSVNSLCWQPYTSNVCTGSGDKTVSVWDARSGLCVQTFYGHGNAVNHVCASPRGDVLASCDADGAIKIWDVKMVAERNTFQSTPHPLNRLCFDRSATRLAAASDDATVKIFDAENSNVVAELRGHEDAVQSVIFSPQDDFIVSAASDCTFRIWST